MFKYALIFLMLAAFSISTSKSIIFRTEQNVDISKIEKKYSTTGKKIISAELLNTLNKSNVLLGKDKAKYYLEKLMSYSVININDLEANILNELEAIAGVIQADYNRKFSVCKSPKDIFPDVNKLWNMEQIKIKKAWKNSTGKGIIISLIDTGIDFYHPALKNGLWINSKEDLNKNNTFEAWSYLELREGISGDLNGKDDDGNGYADDVIGFDFVDQIQVAFGDYSNPDAIPEDEGEHGTNVAGIMIANGIGSEIIGAAYDAKLMIAKAFDITGNAEADDIAKAIVYSVLNGANVINMSFGDDYPSQIVHDAIKFAYYSGCVIVASSGNNGWNLPHYPSDYPEVISVGGSTEENQKWGFANYGPFLDVIAPARNVLTTNVGGTYKTINGTSIASPHVSAVAALLLEQNPKLNNDDVKSILQITAFAVNDYDSTYQSGSGIIDASKAVENIIYAKQKLDNPDFDFIAGDNSFPITIKGTITHPLFDRAEINVANNPSAISWKNIANLSEQIVDGEIGLLDKGLLVAGKNLISIRTYLKNNSFIDEVIPIYYFSQANEFKFDYINNIAAYKNEKRVRVIGARTSHLSDFYVIYTDKSSPENRKISKEFNRFTQNHQIVLEDLLPGATYDATAFAISGSDTIKTQFEFTQDIGYFTTANFEVKPYNTNRSYIYGEIGNFYSNNIKTFAVNDLQNLYIGKTYTKQLIDGTIKNIDSLEKGYIPIGMGDSNGDGIPELLTSAEFNTILYQSKSLNGNPFETELFQNAAGTSLWGEQFFDIDRDGKQEIIGYSYEVEDRSYKVIKNINNQYELAAIAMLPDGFRNISIERGSALEDLDGDGNYELCFVNTRGNLFIFEFKDNKLSLEFLDSFNTGYSNQYVTKADVDGDGIYEVLHGSYGTNFATGSNGYTEPLWYFRLIKSKGPNQYETAWSDFVFPVRDGATRQGFFYRNGVAAGNLDNEVGDEVILLPFPNLYVLKWNKQTKGFENFWYYPSSLSNSAVIADLDGNGINEIGFTTFNAMRFFEYKVPGNYPAPPGNLDGWAESTTSAYLEWGDVYDADKYEVYQLASQNGEIVALKIAEIQSNSILLNNLKENTVYEFVLKTISSKYQENASDFSNIITVFTKERIKPLNIEMLTHKNFKLHFSGKISTNSINPGIFEISIGNTAVIPSSVNVISDSVALINLSEGLIKGNYVFSIGSFRDYYRNFTIAGNIDLYVGDEPQKKELYLTKLELLSETLLKLHFSEDLEIDGAINRDNYKLAPLGEALFAEIDHLLPNAVLINISQLFRNSPARGRNYTITVQNISSVAGNRITDGPGNTLGFVINANYLTDAFVYPNPIRYSEDNEIYFANLTQSATVTIMTSDGAEILKLYEKDGNGGVEWDGRDSNGNLLPTGIYLFKVEGKDNQGLEVFSETKKFVILP